jgi:hypothetical protein
MGCVQIPVPANREFISPNRELNLHNRENKERCIKDLIDPNIERQKATAHLWRNSLPAPVPVALK